MASEKVLSGVFRAKKDSKLDRLNLSPRTVLERVLADRQEARCRQELDGEGPAGWAQGLRGNPGSATEEKPPPHAGQWPRTAGTGVPQLADTQVVSFLSPND